MMEPAMAVAILALVISLVSAMYARRSAEEAKRANQLSLHGMQVKVLNAILEFQKAVPLNQDSIDSLALESFNNALASLLKDAVVPSKLYLSSEHSSALSSTYDNLKSAAQTIENGYYGDATEQEYKNATANVVSEAGNIQRLVESISNELRISRA